MPTNPTKSMARRLEEARIAVEGVRAERLIYSRLRRVGFGEEQIAEGEELVGAVSHAMEQIEVALLRQRESTRALRRARAQLDRALKDAVQLTRVMLQDERAWLEQAGAINDPTTGGAQAQKSASLESLLARANRFFDTALGADPHIQARLAQIGLGATALAMGTGLASAVESAYQHQQVRMEEYSRAVTVQANAFESLDDWMRAFIAVARVALRDRPDLLASLGIAPRGRPRKDETTGTSPHPSGR